ncbi:glycosyltransferase [Enterovibrio norvegicus]|uniref:glycosyltransferase n=1 Tax=Enterovibrio norvegicus TaxID=188144 RepID=UPI00354FE434
MVYEVLLSPIIFNICILSILLLALFFPVKKPGFHNGISVTIVLPTYNDENGIVGALNSIEIQKGDFKLDVMIVNDGSTDATLEVVKKWLSTSRRKYSYRIFNLKKNSGRKALAIEAVESKINSDTDVVVIMDGDTVLANNALTYCLDELYSSSKMGAVCGMIVPHFELGSVSEFIKRAQYYELVGAFHGVKYAQGNIGSVNTLAGAFSAHKMEAIKDVGWFGGWLAEDVCWTWKARSKGWRIGFARKAIAYTDCPDNLNKLWLQRRRWSRGRVEAIKVAFFESKLKFLSVLPWFLYHTMQLVSVPLLIIAAFFIPKLAFLVYVIMFSLHWIYAFNNLKVLGTSNRFLSSFRSAIWSSLIVDVLLSIPNILGYFDEIFRAPKSWLTR